MSDKCEIWDVFEIKLISEKCFKKPFSDVELAAYFNNGKTKKKVYGFYDGDSTWKIRFMPEEIAQYSYFIESNHEEFNNIQGSFESTGPSFGNHGPADVYNKYHFRYADGTPVFILGTTAYVWAYMPEETRKRTLETLKEFNFNKVRMAFFPKRLQVYNGIDISYDPHVYPFEGEKAKFDFRTFNVEYFRNFEERVRDLMKLGIQADIILFHFYDFGYWGINPGMDTEDDLFFVKYIISRLSAFRNVWWSLANEYDIFKDSENKRTLSVLDRKDWDLIGNYIKDNDPYSHPRSIHNWTSGPIYPDRSWMTHVSYQNGNTYTLMLDLRNKYGKPVICDEYEYEGNIPHEWGNSSAETTVLRHWQTVMAGGYGTHGECYIVNGDEKYLFWSYGGTMMGQSPLRLKYLKEIIEECPYTEMEPDHAFLNGKEGLCIKYKDEIFLMLFRYGGVKIEFSLDSAKRHEGIQYEFTKYDAWNCTVIDRGVMNGGYNCIFSDDWTVVKLVKKTPLFTTFI